MSVSNSRHWKSWIVGAMSSQGRRAGNEPGAEMATSEHNGTSERKRRESLWTFRIVSAAKRLEMAWTLASPTTAVQTGNAISNPRMN